MGFLMENFFQFNMINDEFKPDYLKCPNCKNVLDMSFLEKSCPSPLCGFDFNGLAAYLEKSEEELRKIIVNTHKDREGREYKLAITAVKYHSGNYLAHFIECGSGAHYNTLFNDLLLNFFDDLNLLKAVLKSDVIKPKDNVVVSKGGYKMFWELYDRLKKLNTVEIRNFLIEEFPDFHRQHYNDYFLKYEAKRKTKNKYYATKNHSKGA